MVITNVLESEVEVLKSLHDNSFPFPDLDDCIVKQAVIDNGILVGMGIVRLTTEGILIINKDLSSLTKSRCIQGLINNMVPKVKSLGIKDCHVFVQDYKMIRFLQEIGFQDCKGGKAMILFL